MRRIEQRVRLTPFVLYPMRVFRRRLIGARFRTAILLSSLFSLCQSASRKRVTRTPPWMRLRVRWKNCLNSRQKTKLRVLEMRHGHRIFARDRQKERGLRRHALASLETRRRKNRGRKCRSSWLRIPPTRMLRSQDLSGGRLNIRKSQICLRLTTYLSIPCEDVPQHGRAFG